MEPRLEFVFQVRLDFATRMKAAPMANGVQRGYTGVAGGVIEGPRLNGRVVPESGGDWPYFMPDGVVHFEAKYLFEADDGTMIVLTNRGCRHAAPEVLARMDAFERIDPATYYFRVIPTFDVPKGPHDWLARTLIVGAADRTEHHSTFYYYAVV